MKNIFIIMSMFVFVCSFAFADNGVYLSPGVGFWKSPIEILYTVIPAADYAEVSDATVNTNGGGTIPLTVMAALEAGYHLDSFSFFLKFAIGSDGSMLCSNNESSETYYNSSSGTYSTFTDYAKTTGSIWEMNLTINASYDWLLTENKVNGISLFAAAGGGVEWLFLDRAFGFYEVGSWASSYSGSGSPTASSALAESFDVTVPVFVPLAEAGGGFRFYFDRINSISIGALVSCYLLPRISENTSYIQDNDGNALELIIKNGTFAPRFYISYGLNR